MKRFLLFTLVLLFSFTAKSATITWDGGGSDGLWATAANWSGNVVPGTNDDVVLNNSVVTGNYIVTLPGGAISTTINTLIISPNSGNTIRLIIPASNTAAPALAVNQGSGDVLIINNGGILENSSTAAGMVTVINISGTGKTRINNGGRYIHNTTQNPVTVVYSLSTVAGTELGVFEYAQNGTSTFPSNVVTYGSIELTTTGTQTFSTTGSTDITIKGFLKINAGVTFNSTKNGAFLIAGDLIIDGDFDLSPTSSSVVNSRRLIFNGTSNQTISGSGNFTFGVNFFNIEVNSGSTVTLQRGINISNVTSKFLINTGGSLHMATNIINGTGSFQLNSGGLLGIGSVDGITAAPVALGNVQTAARSFSINAVYEYNGTSPQVTGNGLPTTIAGTLKINSNAGIITTGVTLSQNTTVSGSVNLASGRLTTSSANMLTMSDNATYTGGSINSFVNGPMKKEGDDNFTFPVGFGDASGNIYAPIGIINYGGDMATDEFKAEYKRANPQSTVPYSAAHAGFLDHVSSAEYWTLEQTIGTASKNVSLDVHLASFCMDLAKTYVSRWNGSQWTYEPSTVTSGPFIFGINQTGVIKSFNPISGFTSPNIGFTLSTDLAYIDNPLPINLISFDATKLSNTKSSVNWELAACCSAAAKFEIQRAGTERGFVTIGTVGGSATNTSYNYIDNGLKNGVNYYRLKMIDEDGKVTYSRTVAVMNGVNGLLLTSLIPTIITNNAVLTIASSNQQKLDIIILDMQGKVMLKRNYTITPGNSNIELSLNGLAAGVYQLTGISLEGKTNTIRFIKQ